MTTADEARVVDLDTRTDPPINRFGRRLNDDYLAPACEEGGEHGCYSNACCCTCHQTEGE